MRTEVRDVWLDAMRSVSIVRVLLVHTFVRFGEGAVVPLSFILPGMPIVFVVSGALAFAALTRDPTAVVTPAAAGAFLRDRLRRLLVPFWIYSALVVGLLLVSAARSDHRWHQFEAAALWRFLVPFADPVASPAWKHLALHLWFVPPFFWLLLAAPALVAIHRRWFGLGIALTASAATIVELGEVEAHGTWRNVLAYGVAFQVGFLLRDARARRPPAWVLLLVAALAVSAGVALHLGRAPERMLNETPLAHLLVGLGMLPLWILARGGVAAVFAVPFIAAVVRAVNSRAYTLFLYGPAANEIGWRLASKFAERSFTAIYLGASLLAAVGLAWLFGHIEARQRSRARS